MNMYITAVLTGMLDAKTILIGKEVIMEILTTRDRLTIFGCIIGLELAGVWWLDSNRQNYKSKLIQITPDIYTPAPAGQNQCGSAKWLPKRDYDKAFSTCLIPKDIIEKNIRKVDIPSGGYVLGKVDTKEGEKVYYMDTDTHVLSIGATRSGKTRCAVLQTIGLLGLAGESILATDVKGELVDYTKPFLEQLGYEVLTINYDEPVYSDLWNYLQVIINYVDEGDIPAAIDATWDLTSQLVGEPKGERIWNDGEASMIAAAIMAVVYDNRFGENKKYQNLANVYYFLINMCKPIGNILPLSVYVARLPENHPAKGLLGVSDIAPSRTKGSFYTAAVMTLRLFTNPYIANMSSASSFDPADLGRKKMAVFIVLPDDRLTYHTLATLFVSQVYTMLSKEAKRNGGRLKNRVNVVADEFGNFTKISNFEQMLTVSGGKGIRYYLFLQDFAQIEKTYEKTGLRTIRGNCETWVYLQSDDPETLKEISDKLDKYTTSSYTTNMSSNRNNTKVTSTGSSNNLVGRELLTTADLKRIKRPYSLVTSRADPAILYAPDLSCWQFNELFGMGDEEHNRRLRQKRQEQRVKQDISADIVLWGIWEVYSGEIRRKQKEKEVMKLAEKMEQMEVQTGGMTGVPEEAYFQMLEGMNNDDD
ncbi:MAG: type IV secretory system conjugative DNA transfer family protein [Lachnospiraceae bacterium]|nr:type IV secretory system conjugative DNA transfer family protein [Lachnospiraceae bacterium]